MSFNLDETMIGIWCAFIPKGNILAALSREEEGIYRFDTRLRMYVDDKAHDSDDKRTFFSGRFKGTEAEAIEGARIVYRNFNLLQDGWELIRGERSMEEFMQALASMPGIHMKVETLQ